jgi:putative lipoic acid-binding regulatory protein
VCLRVCALEQGANNVTYIAKLEDQVEDLRAQLDDAKKVRVCVCVLYACHMCVKMCFMFTQHYPHLLTCVSVCARACAFLCEQLVSVVQRREEEANARRLAAETAQERLAAQKRELLEHLQVCVRVCVRVRVRVDS